MWFSKSIDPEKSRRSWRCCLADQWNRKIQVKAQPTKWQQQWFERDLRERELGYRLQLRKIFSSQSRYWAINLQLNLINLQFSKIFFKNWKNSSKTRLFFSILMSFLEFKVSKFQILGFWDYTKSRFQVFKVCSKSLVRPWFLPTWWNLKFYYETLIPSHLKTLIHWNLKT
jgi:hypothetical protein